MPASATARPRPCPGGILPLRSSRGGDGVVPPMLHPASSACCCVLVTGRGGECCCGTSMNCWFGGDDSCIGAGLLPEASEAGTGGTRIPTLPGIEGGGAPFDGVVSPKRAAIKGAI